MRQLLTHVLHCGSLWALLLPPASRAAPPEPPSENEPAWQILQHRCLECHQGDEPEGELRLVSRAEALRGGSQGPAVVPGDPAASRLVQLLAEDADPHMPPEEQLSADEVVALRRWISAGARWPPVGRETATPPPLSPDQLQALPPGYSPVLALALAPDERRLAVGRGNLAVVVDCRPAEPTVEATLRGHRDVVQSLAWSADGKYLATAGYRRVSVWDVAAGRSVWELPHAAGRVTAVAFLPDANQVVTADGEAGEQSHLHIWAWAASQPQRSWPAHEDAVLDLAVRPGSPQLITAGADGVAKIWNWKSAELITKLEGHAGHVTATAVTRNGRLAATAGADREIWLWDLERPDHKRSLGQQLAVSTDLAWSAAGESLFAVGSDGLVRRFRGLSKPEELFQQSRRSRRDHVALTGSPGWSDAVAVAGDAKTIYAGYHNGQLFRWSLDKQQAEAKPGTSIAGATVVGLEPVSAEKTAIESGSPLD